MLRATQPSRSSGLHLNRPITSRGRDGLHLAASNTTNHRTSRYSGLSVSTIRRTTCQMLLAHDWNLLVRRYPILRVVRVLRARNTPGFQAVESVFSVERRAGGALAGLAALARGVRILPTLGSRPDGSDGHGRRETQRLDHP